MSYSIINKGKFLSPTINNFVSPVQYLFVNENGRKFLLLKLSNDRQETVSGVTVAVSQKDARGDDLGTVIAESPVSEGSPRTEFVFDRKIALAKDCADFEVKVVSAAFGNYIYTATGKELQLSYQKQRVTQSAGAASAEEQPALNRNPAVFVKRFKIPVILCLGILMILAASYIFSYWQLSEFMANSDSFMYADVEYAFVGGDKSEKSDIYVVTTNARAKQIVIPEKIRNHKVVDILDTAFTGNNVIEKLTIKGSLEIKDRMFAGCSKLSVVNFPKVSRIGASVFSSCVKLSEFYAASLTSIGQLAFENCTSLKSFKISNNQSDLKVGQNIFRNCSNLAEVDIDQFIDYSQSMNLFSGCFRIESLRLKNFNYSYTQNGQYYSDSEKNTITELFGSPASTGSMRLNTLVIDYCGKIYDNFCSRLPLRSLTIKHLENAEIGNNAFSNCANLKSLEFPLAITRVGQFAFLGTAMTAFDGSKLKYIDDNAFSDCMALSVFDLENNKELTHIGAGAFSGCAFVDFFLPKQINEISDSMFQGCDKLTGLTLGGDLNKIGNSAFSGCTALKQAPFLSQVTSIGTEAFSWCVLLESLDFSEELASIGERAFYGCKKITAVTVPQNVRRIGLGAFEGLTQLKEITLPFIGETPTENGRLWHVFGNAITTTLEKVTVTSASEIGANAFHGYSSIKEIIIESNFTRIGNNAFYGCKNLNKFTIPASVTQISENAFSGCYKLYEIYNLSSLNIVRSSLSFGMAGYFALKVHKTLDEEPLETVVYDDFEFGRGDQNDWYLINYSGAKTLLTLPQSFNYDGSLITSYEIIKYFMTDSGTVKEITITGGATAIGEYSFNNCSELSVVKVSDSVKQFGAGAFFGCNKMKEMTLPFIGGSRTANRFLGYIFGGSNMNSEFIPRSLTTLTFTHETEISDNAFYNCGELTKISLTGNITKIGSYAFYNCGRLSDFMLPETLVSIGERAFYNCGAIASVSVPDTVTAIGFGAFSGCSSIRQMSIPFVGGSPDANRYFGYIFGAPSYSSTNSIPYSLKTVSVTKATEIPINAFYNCNSLNTVNLNDAVQTIGDNAFLSCYYITEVNFPAGLKSIGDNAFSSCQQLKEIVMPNSVQTIGVQAFNYCTSLQKVTLKSQINIKNDAFYGCRILHEVYNLGNMSITAGEDRNGYVAYYAIAVYRSLLDTPMEEVILDGIVFKHYNDIWAITGYNGSAEEINLSSFTYKGETISSYSIKNNAFQNKWFLQTLTIGKEVSSIGEEVFSNCSSLKTVDLKSSVITELDNNTFSYCRSLTSVELPKTLTRIGSRVFVYCTQLYSLKLPENVTEIDYDAFWGCYALCDVYNFSKTLTVTKGSGNNGSVAYYALRVSTTEAEALKTFTSGDIRFMQFGQEWYVIYVGSYNNISLPKTVTYNGTTISSYVLLESALLDYGVNQIFIPTSVSRIQRFLNWTFSVGTINYEGTQAEWQELIKNIPGSSMASPNKINYNSKQ